MTINPNTYKGKVYKDMVWALKKAQFDPDFDKECVHVDVKKKSKFGRLIKKDEEIAFLEVVVKRAIAEVKFEREFDSVKVYEDDGEQTTISIFFTQPVTQQPVTMDDFECGFRTIVEVLDREPNYNFNMVNIPFCEGRFSTFLKGYTDVHEDTLTNLIERAIARSRYNKKELSIFGIRCDADETTLTLKFKRSTSCLRSCVPTAIGTFDETPYQRI